MTIHTQHAELLTNLIYLVSFMAVLAGYLRQGLRDGTPITSLCLIFVSGMVLFRAGIYLFPMSGVEFREFLLYSHVNDQGEKSITGGVLGIGGLLLAIYWIKENLSVLKGIAVPLIAALALQNISCYIAGCCYGTETGILWGMNYSGHTLPVHPVQLILFVLTLFIAVFTHKVRVYLKAPLSPLLAGLSLFFLAKMLTEFIRDSSTDHSLGYIIFGLKAIQWIQLGVSLLLALVLWLFEKYYRQSNSPKPVSVWRFVSLLLFILVIAWKIKPLIDYTAGLVLLVAVFTSLVLVSWQLLKSYTLRKYRLLTVSLFLLSGIFMGQTYIPSKNEKITFTETGGSLQIGNFIKEVGQAQESTDCDGKPIMLPSNVEEVRYHTVGAAFNYAKITQKSEFRENRAGINGFLGYSGAKSSVVDEVLPYFALQPNIGSKGRYAGIDAGLLFGYFHFNSIENGLKNASVGEVVGNPKGLYIHPSISFFVGPYDLIYLKYSHAFSRFSPVPGLSDMIVLGSGLGKTDGRYLEVGYSTSGYTGQLSLPIKKNTMLNISGNYINEPDRVLNRSLFSVGMTWRLKYQTKNLTPEVSNESSMYHKD